MNFLEISEFDPVITLLGGQSFLWEKRGDDFYGVCGNIGIHVRKSEKNFYWQTYPEPDNFAFIQSYFRINYDISGFNELVLYDDQLSAAFAMHHGLRVLKQDFVDTVLSFIISQNSNIPKIKKSIHTIRQQYGTPLRINGEIVYTLPDIERLSEITEEEFRALGVGYRAPYLTRSFESIKSTELDKIIHHMTFDEARKALLALHGVGEKVADCIMVFSLNADHITPLDVWGKRVITKLYNLDPSIKYHDMLLWLQKKFGNHTALAGQYLFEYVRSLKIR